VRRTIQFLYSTSDQTTFQHFKHKRGVTAQVHAHSGYLTGINVQQCRRLEPSSMKVLRKRCWY